MRPYSLSNKLFTVLLTMMLGMGTAATAQDDMLDLHQVTVEESSSLWLAYGPETSGDYSFWYGGQNGLIANWTLPKGYSLGELRFPTLTETGERHAPTFTFEGTSRLLQKIIVAEGAAADTSSIALSLTYGNCTNACTQQTATATVGTSPASLPLAEGESLAVRKRGLWTRAENEMLGIGLHKNYNKDGRVDRVFFLPLDADLSQDPAPLRLEAFKQTGFFSNFALNKKPARDEIFSGILVLDKPNAGGLEAYSVAPKNDLMRSGIAQEEMPILQADIPKTSYALAIVFALIGGLILNVMPCVFPVLALKVFSAIKSGASHEAEIRKDATAYTLGVIASFALLAGVLIAIRAAGIGAGWGYQLQLPAFVLIMALIFFVMGLNFLGIFEIRGFFSDTGQSLTEKKGTTGSFFTGVLATVVAAPCTAPFMVTAVAFALAQPPVMAISIFMALGLGLSIPYLLIGFVPASRRFFPKPGAWMVTFRHFLAFPMFATVVWMVWILSIQSGSSGVLLSLVPMVLIAFAVWASKSLAGISRALIMGLGAVAVVYALTSVKPAPKRIVSRDAVQITSSDVQMIGAMEVIPFSQEKLASLRAEGKNVFIHHWAAWCMICLMHENLVFSTEAFQQFLSDNNIVFMMADRTNNDAELIAFMEKAYGRSSQPIDVFYTSDMAQKPIVFPTLFTTGKVTKLMQEAMAQK